jgi:hypothetical protein
MKRSFRTATVFAGVAALGTALAPAAHAATTAPGTMTRITPGITGGDCSKTGHGIGVLVLYYPGTHGPGCFSGTGIYRLGAPTRFKSYCADHLKGHMWIGHKAYGFTEGVHPLYSQLVSQVSISTYTSHSTICLD